MATPSRPRSGDDVGRVTSAHLPSSRLVLANRAAPSVLFLLFGENPSCGRLHRQRRRGQARETADRRAPTCAPVALAGRAATCTGAERVPEDALVGRVRGWHLGLTDGAPDEAKSCYAFVYGDFRRAHRMGLIACHYRAAEWQHKGARQLAAHKLLQYLDRTTA